MIRYVTGDLLASSSECLVNTVNCDGYMGKGIAYQFKMQFPGNNISYVKACKSKELQVGKLHVFTEREKIIINFPTKNHWRNPSKMEYILLGLEELVKILPTLGVKSIAIPPLGSGNGGLIWGEVKPIILQFLEPLADDYDICIYEPSKNYVAKPVEEPKLTCANLVLMDIKLHLSKFNRLRLQKAAFLVNISLKEDYFKFTKYTYGPYNPYIDKASKAIKSFQEFHKIKDTQIAYDIAYKKMISDKIEKQLIQLKPAVIKACELINKIDSDKDVECIATVTYLLKENNALEVDEILQQFSLWSKRKEAIFNREDIENAIRVLRENNLVEETLIGYTLIK